MRSGVTLEKSYDGKDALELDGIYVEAKTLRFKQATIEWLLDELRGTEERALAHARVVDPTAHILPHSGYGEVAFHGAAKEEALPVGPYYAGSYHFWFTLPHSPLTLMDSRDVLKFAKVHSAFAHLLQWLEPLLLACTAGDPRAIGSGTLFPRANMRGVLNNVSGIGTTDACGITRSMDITFPEGRTFAYFDSDGELEAAIGRDLMKPETAAGRKPVELSPPHVHDGKRAARMYMLMPSSRKRQPVLSCRDVDRTNEYERRYIPAAHAPKVATLGGPHLTAQKNSLSPTLLERELTRMGAGFEIEGGNNLRFTWCGKFGLRLLPDWVPVPVRSNKTFVARFYNVKTGRIVKEAPVQTGPGPDLVGFEFRLMDNLPRASLLPLMRVFALTAAASQESPVCSGARAQDDPHWAALVAAVLVEGRFAAVPPHYLTKLARLLGVRGLPTAGKKRLDAMVALRWVVTALHDAYAQHEWTRLLLKRQYAEPPVPLDSNFHAWCDAFEQMIPRTRMEDVLAHIGSPAWLLKNPDWKHDVPYVRAYLSS